MKPIFGQRSITKRLARTVFFGAAPTIGSSHVGLETQRVFLGAAMFFGSRQLDADRYAAELKKIHDEVLSHLAATPGVQLSVRIEIEAVAPDGFDDNKVRTVRENANTLKFEQAEFEER